ncbi:MAG: helix-turn-helix transcriptional regulator [Candidatus Izimaplasma sp.]|nr:helix-turn-helix transcriptional regulator [Candidatus Izimaplasma bacterium]
MELHDKLRILRKLKNLTQQNISQQFYISRQAVQKWESGETSPDITKLLELAEIYGITVDDLLNRKLDEQSLIKKTLIGSDDNSDKNPDIMDIIKKASTIDWILFSIILFGTAIIVVLLHLLGVLIVTFSFFTSLALAGIGVYSIVNIILDIQQGMPTFFINVGLSIGGLTSSYLSYKFFIWFIYTYIKFVKDVTLRFKDYGLLKGLVFMENRN